MPVSFKTRIMLWGRSGGKCFLCKKDLILNNSPTDESSLIGDIAHIVAEQPDGSRGHSQLTPDERNDFENLILLCKNCHKEVDDQPVKYPIEVLSKLKTEHIDWVNKNLKNFDQKEQRDKEIYAMYIDEWEKLAHIQEWHAWTSWVLGPNVEIHKNIDHDLRDLRKWIFNRIWPKRYVELEKAFENFSSVLHDFQETFHEYSERPKKGEDFICTERFYRIEDWDPPRYKQLVGKYENHVSLVSDLIMELTKAANLICDKIRQNIAPWYRLKEGVLIVEAGPFEDLKHYMYRPEYSLEEKSIENPYPGLEKIKRKISEHKKES